MKPIQLLLILFLFPLVIVAQEGNEPGSASVSVNVSANVVATIDMVTLSDFNIGSVQPSQGEIIIDPGQDGGAALLMFSGSPNREIRVTYTPQVQLTKPDAPSLTAYYSLNGYPENEQGSSVPLEENPTTVTLSNDGEYYVWIGCRINIEQATSGAYDGDCAIEVEYN
ncbi:MAG: hypothetical protein K9N46_11680 [Candidatus Marinimicrobia bacterium]|nr:hypothetical protein [Candidatus Neomarinimicrobiota bacterium]MCF7827378.1 hypothetical protein [Candidatus Neomarinimicrobiota bacterium]MCF7881389.1 hypothetical protein [Candidatus Neomarinimicrobiota bacterium]